MPDQIFRRAKAEAAMEGRTLRAFVLDAGTHELERVAGKTSRRRRVTLPLVKSSQPGSLSVTGDVIESSLADEDSHVLA